MFTAWAGRLRVRIPPSRHFGGSRLHLKALFYRSLDATDTRHQSIDSRSNTTGLDMAVINAAEGHRLTEQHDLWAARGRAIQGYAGLEYALCSAFALCAGLTPDIAVSIFFKLNAQPQRQMLKELLSKKFGTTHAPFWTSVLNRLEKLTGRRNNIVHWSALAVIDADDDGKTKADVYLKPATVSVFQLDGFDKLTAEDMRAFETECDYWARAITAFCNVTADDADASHPEFAMWLDVFSKPLTYPPETTHAQTTLLTRLVS